MNTFTSLCKRAGLIAMSSLFLFSATSNAATFTAVTSGNFSSSTTWGGTAPSSMVSADAVIIPPGITVTLTSDQSFTGTSSLTVNGTLTSTGNALLMSGGSLAGSGVITVDSVVLGLASGISYTGSITANKLTSVGALVSSSATVTVNNALHLWAGVLNFTSGSITMSNGATIYVTNGSLSVGGSANLMLTNAYNVHYSGSSITTGVELSGAGLTDVTVDVSGVVTLSTDASVNGTLDLVAGTLDLNSHNLSITTTGDLSGSGSIKSSAGSDISIAASGGITGDLRFISSGNSVNNLTINMGSANDKVNLGSDLKVFGQLNLQKGMVNTMAFDLELDAAATVMGGSANSYVATNGTGMLTMNLAGGANAMFHVGTMTKYAPVLITAANSSANGDVSITVIDTVYANGTGGTALSSTQPLVSATWYVTSSATASINYDIKVMWSSSMEVNSFNRGQAYISHYTSGSWDVMASAGATAETNGMYSMTRTGITSLSPFTVADKDADMTGIFNPGIANSSSVKVYPNPAAGTLYFNTSIKVNKADIYDITGHNIKSVNIAPGANSISVGELPSGVYQVHFYTDDAKAVKKFIKQ